MPDHWRACVNIAGHRFPECCAAGQSWSILHGHCAAYLRWFTVHLHHGHCVLRSGRQPDDERRHLSPNREICELLGGQRPRRHGSGAGSGLCILRSPVRFCTGNRYRHRHDAVQRYGRSGLPRGPHRRSAGGVRRPWPHHPAFHHHGHLLHPDRCFGQQYVLAGHDDRHYHHGGADGRSPLLCQERKMAQAERPLHRQRDPEDLP